MEVVVYGRIYVPNKTDDVNLNAFNLVTGINESKLLTKHISCECKYKFDGKKCGIMINVNVSAKIWENITYAKKITFRVLVHLIVKMVNIFGRSVVRCDEITEVTTAPTKTALTKTDPTKTISTKAIPTKPFPTKSVWTNFVEKKVSCEIENFYILLTFPLITILISIIVSIYCCLIKHPSKQEPLLPYYNTNKKLKENDINKTF